MSIWRNINDANALLSHLLGLVNPDNTLSLTRIDEVALAELRGLYSRDDLTRSSLIHAIIEMHKGGLSTLQDCEQLIEAQASLDASQSVSWRFFIPVPLTLSSDLPSKPWIGVLGKRFEFMELSTVVNHLRRKRDREILRNPRDVSTITGTIVSSIPLIYVSASCMAPTAEEAWVELEPAFDAYRGIFELTAGIFSWQSNSHEMALRTIVAHPRWMVARSVGRDAVWFRFEITTPGDTSQRSFVLTTSFFTVLKKNTQLFRNVVDNQSTISLICDCLRLYAQALDTSKRHLCLLGLWQLAERITLAESSGGNTKRVVNRLEWHAKKHKFIGSGYKNFLVLLSSKRNRVVHRGLHNNINDDDINLLKLACETALDWLFQVQDVLPTICHLENYYKLHTVNNNQLNSLLNNPNSSVELDVVKYIREQRK